MPNSGHAHRHRDRSHAHGHEHEHGRVDPSIIESRQGVRVLLISLAVLGGTAAAQAVVVAFTGSVALLADTIHNVGDALTAVPLVAAFIVSRRPASPRYTFGLGRSEDLAGLFIVAAITFSAGVTLYESIQRLIEPSRPDHLLAGMIAGALGFIGNEVVAAYRIRQGRRMASAALVADGYHARVDGFTSLAVVVGLGLVWVGADLADPIVGIAISLTILGISWRAMRDVGRRMLDGIEPETIEVVRAVASTELGDQAVLVGVRARWVGHVIHAEIRLLPSETTSVAELLALRVRLEDRLRASVERLRALSVDFGS